MEQLQTLVPPRKRTLRVVEGEAPRSNGRVIDLNSARQNVRAKAEEGDVEQRAATYQAALQLVERIDHELTYGLRHYRTKAGRLLTYLDEVVNAILSDDLLVEAQPRDTWEQVQELVA